MRVYERREGAGGLHAVRRRSRDREPGARGQRAAAARARIRGNERRPPGLSASGARAGAVMSRASTRGAEVTMVSRRLALLLASGLAVVAGCGSDSPSAAADVGSRVVQADSFLGFPLLTGLGAEAVTDPEDWVMGGPFPLYV